MSIDEQTGEQARLGGVGSAPVLAGTGGELGLNHGPHFIVDQRLMLAGVELAFMRNLTGVNWIGEQPVDVSAREWCATTLGAIRHPLTLCPQSEPVSLVFDPARSCIPDRARRYGARSRLRQG